MKVQIKKPAKSSIAREIAAPKRNGKVKQASKRAAKPARKPRTAQGLSYQALAEAKVSSFPYAIRQSDKVNAVNGAIAKDNVRLSFGACVIGKYGVMLCDGPRGLVKNFTAPRASVLTVEKALPITGKATIGTHKGVPVRFSNRGVYGACKMPGTNYWQAAELAYDESTKIGYPVEPFAQGKRRLAMDFVKTK